MSEEEQSRRGGDGAGAIIKVENLSKTFGLVKAVDNINFEVKEGEERHEFSPPRLRKAAQVLWP